LLPEKEIPVLKPARACGGMIRTWASKYRARVDGPEDAYVDRFAYSVTSESFWDVLRAYETDNYEVVRCTIEMDGGTVRDCTFRSVGDIDHRYLRDLREMNA